MQYKRYAKVITKEFLCAIYEPHPFRSSAISQAIGSHINTGIADDEWTWVYYDWCCNPVGTSDEKPDGVEVDKFTQIILISHGQHLNVLKTQLII